MDFNRLKSMAGNVSNMAGNVNINKFSSDVSSTFNRVKQFTEEKLGKSERTEYEYDFEMLLEKADKTEEHTKKVVNAIESYLQPDPTARYEQFVCDKLEQASGGTVPIKDNVRGYTGERQNKLELLGQAMLDAGHEFGLASPYGNMLVKVSEAEFKVGAAERKLCSSTVEKTLGPIKKFLENELKIISKERKELQNKRLDLDACKNRLKKAKNMEQDPDPKHGQLTVEQAEADLRVAQTDFERQVEVVRAHLKDLDKAHVQHEACMRQLVTCQTEYYAQAHQHMAELQRQLTNLDLSYSPKTNISGHTRITLPGEHNLHKNGSNSSIAEDDFSTRQATVAFNYEATGVGEINLNLGEVVIIYRLPGMDPDYVMAERGGKRGKVPLSFLDVIS